MNEFVLGGLCYGEEEWKYVVLWLYSSTRICEFIDSVSESHVRIFREQQMENREIDDYCHH